LGFSGSLDSIKGISIKGISGTPTPEDVSGSSGMLEHPASIINALIKKYLLNISLTPKNTMCLN
jgi:hypothetical protein